MKWRLSLLLLCIALITCQKAPSARAPKGAKNAGTSAKLLHIYAPYSFRSSGLEGVIIPDFEKETACRVRLYLYEDSSSLAELIKSGADSLDIVLGVDNGMAQAEALHQYFASHAKDDFSFVSRECVQDNSFRLIPYAYSYLALLYNTRIFAEAPKTFGELQDGKYMRQLAMLQPDSPWGRSFLHFSVALFGEEGYIYLLGALKKNLYRSYDTPLDAIAAVKKGECGLAIAMFNTAIWQKELDPTEQNLKTQNFKEASFLYSENIGIGVNSGNPELAEAFIQFIFADYAQNMLLYKSGLLPAKASAALPQAYSMLPLSMFAVNDRLSNMQIHQQHEEWLRGYRAVIAK